MTTLTLSFNHPPTPHCSSSFFFYSSKHYKQKETILEFHCQGSVFEAAFSDKFDRFISKANGE